MESINNFDMDEKFHVFDDTDSDSSDSVSESIYEFMQNNEKNDN